MQYDALITEHGDSTATVTLYQAGTTTALLRSRIPGLHWNTATSDGYKRFPSLDEAEAFIHAHVPLNEIFRVTLKEQR